MKKLVLLLLIVLAGATPLAFPQSAIAAKKTSPAKSSAKGKKKGNIIVIDAEVIKGRVQKPEAFYILQRSNLNYRSLEPKKSFIPLILESVKKEPF